jgi:hypothetical protein
VCRHGRYLLDCGARINEVDCYGGTAVYEASFWGRCAVVRLLLERGADPSRVRTDTRRSPVMAAVSLLGVLPLTRHLPAYVVRTRRTRYLIPGPTEPAGGSPIIED